MGERERDAREKMSKRKKKTTTTAPAVDVYIPDDLWGAIAGCIPWDDVKTLLSFLCVSRQAIRFVLPCVKELCSQFQRPHYAREHPLLQTVLRNMFGITGMILLHERRNQPSKLSNDQRKVLINFSFEELKVCMLHFYRLEESALTTTEWRECSASILSIMHLAMLRDELCTHKTTSAPRLGPPQPSHRVSSLFHYPLGSPHAAQRLKKLANLRIVQNMATNNPQPLFEAKPWLAAGKPQ